MSVVQAPVQLSPHHLLEAARQLETADLNKFVDAVIALRAKRRAPVLPQLEAELLQKINQAPPVDWVVYRELIYKRQAETIASEELAALQQMSERLELFNAQRIQYLAELAQLRQLPLPKLMADLGIHPPEYA